MTRQAIKSATTRARIIDATIRCYVKYGYARTTTLKVAEEAGLSRGAMMHHFESSAALTFATAEELHERRLKEHIRRARELDQHNVTHVVRHAWGAFMSPSFIAFLELSMAARTDADLARIVAPLQREYSERWYHQAFSLYPMWQNAPDLFDLAFSLAEVTMNGLALALMTGSLSEEKVDEVLTNLESQLKVLRAEASARPRPSQSAMRP